MYIANKLAEKYLRHGFWLLLYVTCRAGFGLAGTKEVENTRSQHLGQRLATWDSARYPSYELGRTWPADIIEMRSSFVRSASVRRGPSPFEPGPCHRLEQSTS
jgi:hypothetical protein